MEQIDIKKTELYKLWKSCPYDTKTFEEFVNIYIKDPDWIVIDNMAKVEGE